MRRFATGLSEDYEAVKAGVTVPWSPSPVEGHINRLKMLKRQMFGRARLELLSRRVLLAPRPEPRHQQRTPEPVEPSAQSTAAQPDAWQRLEQGPHVLGPQGGSRVQVCCGMEVRARGVAVVSAIAVRCTGRHPHHQK
jgi:hypothetical protein